MTICHGFNSVVTGMVEGVIKAEKDKKQYLFEAGEGCWYLERRYQHGRKDCSSIE